jgi:hypothetical protein
VTKILGVLIACVLLAGACGGGDETPAAGQEPSPNSMQSEPADEEEEKLTFDHLKPSECVSPRRAKSQVVAITTGVNFFKPDCIMSTPKGEVRIKIKNKGTSGFPAGRHTFTAPKVGVDKHFSGLTSVTLTLEMGSKPIYFVCTIHPTSMVGALFPR